MVLVMHHALIERILAEAAAAFPRECCGILLGSQGRIDAIQPAANVHDTPETRFEIDPQCLIATHREARCGGPRVAGYYHSHPSGLPEPSSTDSLMAAGDGMIWAIAGAGEVRFWRSTASGFLALSTRVEGG